MADLTTEILIQIRDEIRGTNGRVDQTNERLDQTNERLDQTNERLDRVERRQSQAEIRITTEITAVVGAIHELRDTLIADRQFAARVDDHERRLEALERGRAPG
jgi:septal ring factor EnvC (AmiA/AmiB activator)